MTSQSYQQILSLCLEIARTSSSSRPIKGADYGEDLAETIVYDSTEFTEDEDRMVIHATRDDMRPPFEWLVEITTWGSLNAHYLLYENERLVEAYGHKTFEVSEEDRHKLLTFIARLSH